MLEAEPPQTNALDETPRFTVGTVYIVSLLFQSSRQPGAGGTVSTSYRAGHGERASTPKAGRVVHGILPQKSRTVLERFTRRFKNRDVFRGALELLHNGPTSLATRQPAMLLLVSDAPAILPPTLHCCVTTEAHVTGVRACMQLPLTDAGSPRWNARGADSATAGQTTTP